MEICQVIFFKYKFAMAYILYILCRLVTYTFSYVNLLERNRWIIDLVQTFLVNVMLIVGVENEENVDLKYWALYVCIHIDNI